VSLNIKTFINGVQKEFNRISWPSSQETKVTTIAVLVLATIMAAYFVLVDQVIIKVLSLMLGV
jgi:preprotein translocase SecE subunit